MMYSNMYIYIYTTNLYQYSHGVTSQPWWTGDVFMSLRESQRRCWKRCHAAVRSLDHWTTGRLGGLVTHVPWEMGKVGEISGPKKKRVGGWPIPLKNRKVNWDDYSQCMGKWKMFQTTNQKRISVVSWWQILINDNNAKTRFQDVFCLWWCFNIDPWCDGRMGTFRKSVSSQHSLSLGKTTHHTMGISTWTKHPEKRVPPFVRYVCYISGWTAGCLVYSFFLVSGLLAS